MIIFKESALWPILSSSRDVSLYIYLSIYLSPFHVFFLRGIRQALACNKTGSFIGHASILLQAWSLKNGGWVQSWEGIFFAWNNTGFWLLRVIRQARPSAMHPSYYTHGALKTAGACRAV